MKRAALLLSLAGVVLAVALVARDDPQGIARLLLAAGPGLVVAGLSHVVSMLLNARAWQVLLPGSTRPSLLAMTRVVWLRESVNALLPVARVGGELLAYRVLTWTRLSAAFAAAGLVVDMAVSLVSQLVFALVGVGALLARGADSRVLAQVTLGVAILALLAAVFIVVQQRRLFERFTRAASRFVAGRLTAAIPASRRLDRAMRAIYRQRRAVLACCGWQLAGWFAGAIEIWLAMAFLGAPVSAVEAIAIEAVVQAVSSAAFVIPGALGVQEAAFVLVGALLGIDATTALALAGARRLRDLVVFLPGLLAWTMMERARLRGRPPAGVAEVSDRLPSTTRL